MRRKIKMNGNSNFYSVTNEHKLRNKLRKEMLLKNHTDNDSIWHMYAIKKCAYDACKRDKNWIKIFIACISPSVYPDATLFHAKTKIKNKRVRSAELFTSMKIWETFTINSIAYSKCRMKVIYSSVRWKPMWNKNKCISFCSFLS